MHFAMSKRHSTNPTGYQERRLAHRQITSPDLVARAEACAARLACRRAAYDLASTGLQAARATWAQQGGAQRRLGEGLAAEGELWLATAEVQVYQGHYGGAVRSGQQALALFRAANDRGGQGRSCERIAAGMRRRGGHAGALQYYRDAVDHLTAAGNDRVLARVLANMGASFYEMGRLEQASKSYRDADAIFQGLGAPVEHARCQLNAAMLAITVQRLDEAETLLQPALETHLRVGDRLGEAAAHYAAARLRIERSDYVGAEDSLGRSLHLAEQVGLRRQAAAARRLQGWIHHRQGRWRKAVMAYDGAMEAFRELGADGEVGLILLWSSLLAHCRRRIDDADRLHDEAIELLESVESPLAPMVAGQVDDQTILKESFQARRTWDLVQFAASGEAAVDPVERAQRRHGRKGFLRSVLPLRRTMP